MTSGASVPDQALAVPATPANALDGPSGFDPSRGVRRTLSKWDSAPRDGTPFHTLSTMRFNPFRGQFEALCHAVDGRHVWHPVTIEGWPHPPTYWARQVPLPYELPSSFAFTLTYEVRRKTWRERLLDKLAAFLPKLSCDAVYLAAAQAIEARWAATGNTDAVEDESAVANGDAPENKAVDPYALGGGK